ncbi:MAG: hypothetical protein ACXVZ1_05565 [Gaiellaceae bacterium]
MRSRLVFATAAAAALLLPSAGTGGSPSFVPKLLVQTEAPIAAFAQNGDELAWGVERARGCKAALHLRSLRSGRERVVLAPRCYDYPFYSAVGISVGRVLWVAGSAGGHSWDYTGLLVAGAGSGRARQLSNLFQTWGGGERVTAVASDGPTLVYGYLDSACNMDEGSCERYPITGNAYRLVGAKAKAIPGSGPALAVAVSGSRVALLPARHVGVGEDEWQLPPKLGPIAIRNVESGSLITAIEPRGGTYREVAISKSAIAAIIQRPDGRYVDRFTSSGKPIDSVEVPAGASDLCLAGASAIFRSGRRIELLAAGSARSRTLATAAEQPIGLSTSGDRIAWADNVHGKGRILAVELGHR